MSAASVASRCVNKVHVGHQERWKNVYYGFTYLIKSKAITHKIEITIAVPEMLIVIQYLFTFANSVANSVVVISSGMVVVISMTVKLSTCRAVVGLESPESITTFKF